MKSQILAGILGAVLCLPVTADHVDIINQSKPGGTTFKIVQNFATILGAREVGAANCAEAVKLFQETPEGRARYLVITNSELASESLGGDDSCSLPVTEENLMTIVFNSYPKFCSLKSSGLTLTDFAKGGAKVGGYYSKYWQTVLGTLLDDISVGSRPVPYQTSGEGVAGLNAGDVDYIWTGRVDESMNCFLTMNPAGETLFGEEVPPVAGISENPLASWAYSAVLLVNSKVEIPEGTTTTELLEATRYYVAKYMDIESRDGGMFEFFLKKGYIFDIILRDSTPAEQVEEFNKGLTSLK
jgi:hypothetical protein